MVDSSSVMELYNNLLHVLGQFKLQKMNMYKLTIDSSMKDKLPSSWKEFKHALKHQKDELSLFQLARNL